MDKIRYLLEDSAYWVREHRLVALLVVGVVALGGVLFLAWILFLQDGAGSVEEETPVSYETLELSPECAGVQEKLAAFTKAHTYLEKTQSPELQTEFTTVNQEMVGACTIQEQDLLYNTTLRTWSLVGMQTGPSETPVAPAP